MELDGGQQAAQVDYDATRTQKMAANGYRVVRFWNHDVLQRLNDVLEEILTQVRTPPQPSPASRGGSEEQAS